MRKTLLMLLGVLLAIPAFARNFTYTHEGQTLTYTVIDETAKTCKPKDGALSGPGNDVNGILIIPEIAVDGDTKYSVTEIGVFAFYDCRRLTSVTIPNSVKSIDKLAFCRCENMTSVSIPNSVTEIGKEAFAYCMSLNSVTIPNSVKSIGNAAFSNCENMTSVSIPNSVTEIGEAAFSNCESLTSVSIPNSVTEIRTNTFSGCESMTSVTIPNSVKSIGEWAFAYCHGLTSVTIPNSVTEISEAAFYGCRMTSITIPNNVTVIGDYSFDYCENLKEVILPLHLESMGAAVFKNSKAIKNVVFMSPTPVEAPADVFDSSVYKNATLYVRSGSIQLFQNTSPWKYFSNITDREYSSAIEEITANTNRADLEEIFNLNGSKADDSTGNLVPGIYIVRKNNTVKKILVK